MSDDVFFNKMVTKGLEPIESDGRFFEGYLTVQVKDKQGEVTIVDELYKVLPIWMDRGAPITDTHSNRVVGKGINFARAEYKDNDGTMYPAIKVTGKIYNDYELDNEIWKKIKSGEYKGLSFGGSTKTDRQPMRMKDGSIAYSLSKLEHYEVAVCRDPAVPLAVITDTNPIAKSNMNCDNTGCYVTKPVLGQPNFDSAVRNVMEESNVPKKNAERIVGAAEAKAKGNPNLPYNEEYFKKEICNDCGLPKKKGDIKKDDDTCTHCGSNKYGQRTWQHDRTYDDIDNNGRFYTENEETGQHHRSFGADGFNNATHFSKRTAPFEHETDGSHNQEVKHTLHHISEHPDFKNHPSYKQFQKDKITNRRLERQMKLGTGMFKKRKKPIKLVKGKKVKEKESARFKKRFGFTSKHDQHIGRDGKLYARGAAWKKLENLNTSDLKEVHGWLTRKLQSPEHTKDRVTEGMTSAFGKSFKLLVETNKILGKYQGNVLKLSRILDKDAPADINLAPSGNVPKKKEPKGQSHGAQSTAERERGIKEQQLTPHYHYTNPQSMDEFRTLVPHEELGEGLDPDNIRYMRARRPVESMIKPNATLADPRKRKSWKEIQAKIKDSIDNRERVVAATPQEQRQSHGGQSTDARITGRMEENRRGLTSNQMYNRRGAPHGKISRHDDPDYKAEGETQNPEYRGQSEKKRKIPKTGIAPKIASLFDKIKRDISKKKLKKVGSGAMVDPNQANQGAGFAIRNQTQPRRKKVRTMEAKLGDGTYDYSS